MVIRTSVAEGLRDPALAPLWEAVRQRLASRGIANRGRLHVPTLSPEGRLYLGALVGRTTSFVDLATLERALVRRGAGHDLASALELIGYAVPPGPGELRAVRQARTAARGAARDAVAEWPEPWAGEWMDEVIRSGLLGRLDAVAARQFVESVRRVLDAVLRAGEEGRALARVELAASILGDAHALDTDHPLEIACGRALARVLGGGAEDAWGRAGVQSDQVSGPVLTWRLPVHEGPLAALMRAATEAGAPLHLTQLALRRHPVRVRAGTVILVAENPRVVEAAAQADADMPVITTNGNPSLATQLLIDQLLASGAVVRYHGDFDTPGVAICARMFRIGLQPWRMTALDYRCAVADAEREGVSLPSELRPCGPTPWDPDLCSALDEIARIVHEERLLHHLI